MSPKSNIRNVCETLTHLAWYTDTAQRPRCGTL